MLLMVSLTSDNIQQFVGYAGYKLHGADRSPHHHIPAVAYEYRSRGYLRCALAIAFVTTVLNRFARLHPQFTHHTGDTIGGENTHSASSIDR